MIIGFVLRHRRNKTPKITPIITLPVNPPAHLRLGRGARLLRVTDSLIRDKLRDAFAAGTVRRA